MQREIQTIVSKKQSRTLSWEKAGKDVRLTFTVNGII